MNRNKVATLIVAVGLCPLISRAAEAPQCSDKSNAARWIHNFVQSDSEGGRLKTNKRWADCVRIDDEPAWDTVDIINRVGIKKCVGEEACMVVIYKVVATMTSGRGVDVLRSPQNVSVKLKLGDNTAGYWPLIADPDTFPPKVRAPALKKYLLSLKSKEGWVQDALRDLNSLTASRNRK